MRRCFAALFALALAASGAFAAAGAPAELAVAIRYLQAEGTSHAHIYLYREDGKLLRQLTKDDSGQDFDPIFAPDGQTIVFRREKKSGAIEFWSIDPLGRAQKQLPAAPEWYTSAEDAPFFTNADLEPDPSPETSPAPTAVPGAAEPPRTYRASDGSVEVVVRRLASDEEDSINGEGTGKHFLIRDLRAGEEKEMGTLPGFVGLWDVIHRKGDMEQVYLFEGELRLVFFSLHLNSTDGDTVFALDLNNSRFLRLSPNWAAPIPLPGEPAFLTFTYNRYVPIPGSKKTANCLYLERWDAKLNKVRYAREGSAAICYGASVYRAGRTPAVIVLKRKAD